jgi:hypothetical protein
MKTKFLSIVTISNLLVGIFTFSLVAQAATESSIPTSPKSKISTAMPSFQEWKGQQLRQATIALEKSQKEKLGAPSASDPSGSQIKGTEKDSNASSRKVQLEAEGQVPTSASYSDRLHSYAAELEGRLALRNEPKDSLAEAEESFQRAKGLTIVDYVVAHMETFREDPEAMKLVAARMTPHEVFEMMRSYLSFISPTQQDEIVGQNTVETSTRR